VLERWRRAVGSGGKYIRGVRGMEQGAGKSERRAEQCGRAGKWSRRWAAGGRRRCRGAGRSARDTVLLYCSRSFPRVYIPFQRAI
jgi:hypothetical protein